MLPTIAEAPLPQICVVVPNLLGYSATFVAEQVGAYRRYTAGWLAEQEIPGLDPPGPRVIAARHGGRLARQAFRVPGPGARRLAARARTTLDPVLAQVHFGYVAASLLPVLEELEIPWVVTFHGSDATRTTYTRVPPPPSEFLLRRRWRRIGQRADLILAVSDFVRDRLVARGMPADKIERHYIGIDTHAFRPRDELDQAVRTDVLYVGRVVPQKGIEVLLDAWSQLGRRGRGDARLRVVGDGPDLTRLRAATASDPSVVWEGVRTKLEVSRLLASAALLCCPSRTGPDGSVEGLGMVNLEAQASGIPVLASRHGGIPEAVRDGETGILVPEDDPAMLAAALRKVLGSPQLRRELGAAGRALVVDRFDLHRQTAVLEDRYDHILQGACGGSGRP